MASKDDSQSPVEESQQVVDSQGEDPQLPDSQDTLRLSPNLWAPEPLPTSPPVDPPVDQASDGEGSNDDGRITPPHGMVIASDGTIHGDMGYMQDPMTMAIMNVMGHLLQQRLDQKGIGKGKGQDDQGNGVEGTGSSSAPGVAPKAKGKAQSKVATKKKPKRN